jgi:hypothetical protein
LTLQFAADHNFTIDPRFILTDFEVAALNSLSEKFPGATSSCCGFHFGQNIWRRVQKLGLVDLYGTNTQFAHQVKALIALCFLPPDEIPDAFDILAAEFHPSGQSLVQYFSDNYVHGQKRADGSYKNPMFPPSLWSCYDLTAQGYPRTQNHVESWHNRINTIAGGNHVGFYRLLDLVKSEILEKDVDMSLTLAAKDVSTREAVAIDIIMSQKDDYFVKDLLLSLALNINITL